MLSKIFEKRLPPNERIPILNKPPTNASSSTENERKNIRDHLNRCNTLKKDRQIGPRKYIPSDKYDEHVKFAVYEHFAISEKTIRQFCGTGDGCDVHIVFYEEMVENKLPEIGISCLSFEDLWNDQAELQGENATTSHSAFIKMLPYDYDCPGVLNSTFGNIIPHRREALTISFVNDPLGVKVRFSFMGKRPTNWLWAPYPPFVDDFSLVIGIERTNLLKPIQDENDHLYFKSSIEIFTTFGWLKWWQRQLGQPINESDEEDAMDFNSIRNPQEYECSHCLTKGVDVLFYPCGHFMTHRKCLVEEYTDLMGSLKSGQIVCGICREKCTQLLTPRFSGPNCNFCDDGKCQQFNSYFYPCGCSLGCFDGFTKNVHRVGNLNCRNCGKTIENIHQFFFKICDDLDLTIQQRQ